MDRKMDWIS